MYLEQIFFHLYLPPNPMTGVSNGAHEKWQLAGFMEMQTPPAPTAVAPVCLETPCFPG